MCVYVTYSNIPSLSAAAPQLYSFLNARGKELAISRDEPPIHRTRALISRRLQIEYRMEIF